MEKCCGCIIINSESVLIVQNKEGHWWFPKGHMEEGETEVMTAVRETKEETNILVKPDETKRYVSKYVMPNGIKKEVAFFIATVVDDKNIKCQEEEIINLKWVKFAEVNNYFKPDNAKEFWERVMSDLNVK